MAIESSCSPVGSNASRLLACSVMYDLWLPPSKRSRTSIENCGSEGLCTVVRAVCNSTSPLSEQRVVAVEIGWYEGATGLSPVCDFVNSVCV